MSHTAISWLASLDPTQVKPSAFRVLFHLCDHHNDERDPLRACFPSQETLREKTGLSNGALNNALNAMESAELILRRWSTMPGSAAQRTYYILGFDFDQLPKQTPLFGKANSSGLEFAGEQTPVFGGANSSPLESILKVTENTTTAHARAGPAAAACLEACGPGLCETSRRSVALTGEVVAGWLSEGFDLSLDILPLLRGRTARPTGKVIRTWDYFTNAIRRAHAQRLRGVERSESAENQHACRQPLESDPVAHLAAWLNSGAYVPPSAVSNTMRDVLLRRGLVTKELLRARQIY